MLAIKLAASAIWRKQPKQCSAHHLCERLFFGAQGKQLHRVSRKQAAIP